MFNQSLILITEHNILNLTMCWPQKQQQQRDPGIGPLPAAAARLLLRRGWILSQIKIEEKKYLLGALLPPPSEVLMLTFHSNYLLLLMAKLVQQNFCCPCTQSRRPSCWS